MNMKLKYDVYYKSVSLVINYFGVQTVTEIPDKDRTMSSNTVWCTNVRHA
jgi:hypothetical protein